MPPRAGPVCHPGNSRDGCGEIDVWPENKLVAVVAQILDVLRDWKMVGRAWWESEIGKQRQVPRADVLGVLPHAVAEGAADICLAIAHFSV